MNNDELTKKISNLEKDVNDLKKKNEELVQEQQKILKSVRFYSEAFERHDIVYTRALKRFEAILVIAICAILLILMCFLAVGIIYCESHNIPIDKIVIIGVYISLVLVCIVAVAEIAVLIKKNKTTDKSINDNK